MFTQLNYWMLFLLAKHQHRSFHKRKKCWQGRNLTYQTLMTRLEAQAWNGQSWIIITVELTIADDSLVLLDQGVPWDAIGFVLVPQVLLFFFDFVFAQLQPCQTQSFVTIKVDHHQPEVGKLSDISTCNRCWKKDYLHATQRWIIWCYSKVENPRSKGWNLHAWHRGFCAPNLRGPCLQWQDCARNP